MNHHNRHSVPPGGFWGLGTTGTLAGTFVQALRQEQIFGPHKADGLTNNAHTLLVLETAQSGRDIAVRVGPGHPLVSVPVEDRVILPSRGVHELAQECLRHPNTRRYGEKLLRRPDGRTDDGVGAEPLTSLVAMLSFATQLDQLIESRILAQRDRTNIDRHRARGGEIAIDARNNQIICGSDHGGTKVGGALYLAQRIQYFSEKHLGHPSNVYLMGTTPSVSTAGDITKAQANFGAFVRQVVIAMREPKRIVFHNLSGEDLRTSGPLVQHYIPFGRSSGKMAVGTRLEVAAQMAMAASLILTTNFSSFSDSEFRDFAAEAFDQRYGTRFLERFGIGRLAIDEVRSGAIAQAVGEHLVSEYLLQSKDKFNRN